MDRNSGWFELNWFEPDQTEIALYNGWLMCCFQSQPAEWSCEFLLTFPCASLFTPQATTFPMDRHTVMMAIDGIHSYHILPKKFFSLFAQEVQIINNNMREKNYELKCDVCRLQSESFSRLVLWHGNFYSGFFSWSIAKKKPCNSTSCHCNAWFVYIWMVLNQLYFK